MSVRRKTNNRLTLFRKCFICGKDIVTTADTPFIRQIANVNGKNRRPSIFARKVASEKAINTCLTEMQIREEKSEKKSVMLKKKTDDIIFLTRRK